MIPQKACSLPKNNCWSWTSKVMKLTKSSATKTPTSCPKIIKIYSNGMAGVDIIDKKLAV